MWRRHREAGAGRAGEREQGDGRSRQYQGGARRAGWMPCVIVLAVACLHRRRVLDGYAQKCEHGLLRRAPACRMLTCSSPSVPTYSTAAPSLVQHSVHSSQPPPQDPVPAGAPHSIQQQQLGELRVPGIPMDQVRTGWGRGSYLF